jgi:hypothetical protein
MFWYHNRVVIPRQALALIKALLLKYHDNVGYPNYRRLMASLLKRFWWDKMTFDCKSRCQHCVVCNRAKSDRRGGSALQPLGISKYHWEIVTLLKCLTLFHVTRRSLQRSHQIYVLVIATGYMVSLRLLYLTKILSLLGSFGRALWES